MLDTHDKKIERELPQPELTRTILGCCFEVMKELGPGFSERVYLVELHRSSQIEVII